MFIKYYNRLVFQKRDRAARSILARVDSYLKSEFGDLTVCTVDIMLEFSYVGRNFFKIERKKHLVSGKKY